MQEPYETAFCARSDLDKYGDNALLLFALEMRFEIEDIDSVANNSLTDNPDDKKCDLVYVDRDSQCLVVAQGYFSKNPDKASAPSNKASDLNTAATWLFNAEIDELPQKLQSIASEVNIALNSGNISSIQFWYVHNLPESQNVKKELVMVEKTIKNSLTNRFSNIEINSISAIEIGHSTLQEWYQSKQATILVNDEIKIPIKGGYEISGDDWSAFVTTVPIRWLYTVFHEPNKKDKIFSANIRGYLGSVRKNANINSGIKETATNCPENFWVFNNGLTVLVNDYEEIEETNESSEMSNNITQNFLKVKGMSIVNGAQTTGAISSLPHSPSEKAMVQARFVTCKNIKTIKNIIEFNNKQNPVEPSDFRSNDPIQTRLREDFKINFPQLTYLGCRRGIENARKQLKLSSDTVAQALAAFHQDPVLAYNNKSDIWLVDSVYSKFFNEQTTACHIVFVFSLLKCLEQKKKILVDKSRTTQNSLTEDEELSLSFLQQRGSHLLMVAAISKCLETFAGKRIDNYFHVSFGQNISIDLAQSHWSDIVDIAVSMSERLFPAVQKSLNSSSDAEKCIKDFKTFIGATKKPNESIYKSFSEKLTF